MTPAEVWALRALAEATDGRFAVRVLLDSRYPPVTAAYEAFLRAATPVAVAALCTRLLELEALRVVEAP